MSKVSLFSKVLVGLISVGSIVNTHAVRSKIDLKSSDEIVGSFVRYTLPNGGTCSGTFISKRSILTAAHCVLNEEEYDKAMKVYLFDSNKPYLTYSFKVGSFTRIAKPIYNESYEGTMSQTLNTPHDLGIITFKSEIKEAVPVVLDYQEDIQSLTDFLEDQKIKDVFVIGGGGTNNAGFSFSSAKNKKVNIAYGPVSAATSGEYLATIFEKNMGVCRGDSGGAVYIPNTFPAVQIAVNSSIGVQRKGDSCGIHFFSTPIVGENYDWVTQTLSQQESGF